MKYKTFFTPGPSQIYFTVEGHLKTALQENVPSISHRGAAFKEIFASARNSLKALLGLPDGFDIYFTSSANQIWERIIQNLIQEKSHHFVNGAFSKKFYDFAKLYQKNPTITKSEDGRDFDSLAIENKTELIAVTLNETSTGFAFDQEKLKALRSKYPDKLIAADGVSAFPAVPFDFQLVDTAYFSVQKCFGLPAGLGVWIVNKNCHQKHEALKKAGLATGSYHDLATLRKSGLQNQTPETPNILGIYLLGKVAEDMIRKTTKAIQAETAYKAAILYQAIENSGVLKPFVPDKQTKSKTVIVAECADGNSEVLEKMEKQGWIVAKGYGSYKNSHIRIANFPTTGKEQMEQVADFITAL